MPLWNPYIYCGSPQIANPSPGIFYFPNLFFLFLSYSKALALIQMFHQLVAFAAGFLLARLLNFSRAAGVVVGLVLALSGYFFTLPSNYTLPGTFCWGALALYALAKISVERRAHAHGGNLGLPVTENKYAYLGYVVLATFSVHLMLMAGRPEIYVPFFIMFVCMVLLMVLKFVHLDNFDGQDSLRFRWSTAFFQCLAIGLAVLLSTPMMLPVYEWSKLSPRSGGLDFKQIFYWSCNWYDYLGMVFNQPLGDLQQPDLKFAHLVASRSAYYPFLPSAYIGPVALTLVFYGMADKTFVQRYYAFSAAVVAILLSMGSYGPLSSFLVKSVPFFAVLRYPVKLLIFVIFFMAIVAGRGLHFIAAGKTSKVAAGLTIGFWSLATACGAIMLVMPQYWSYLFTAAPPAFFRVLGQPLLITSLIGLLLSAVIAFRYRLKLNDSQSITLIIIAALIGSMAVPAFQSRQKTVAPGYFEKDGLLVGKLKAFVAAEQKNKPAPSNAAVLPPRAVTVYFDPIKVPAEYAHAGTVNGERYMQYCRELLLPNTNIDRHWPLTYGYESAETKDYRTTFLNTLHCSHIDIENSEDESLARFCKITSTVYLASQIVGVDQKGPVRLLNPRWFNKIEEDKANNLRLYRVNESLPRAYLASGWIKCEQKQVISRIFDGPDWPARLTLIEPTETIKPDKNADDVRFDSGIAPGEAVLPSAISCDADAGTQNVNLADFSNVSFLQDQAEHVALSVNCPADSLVVLNDRYYPGWRATIDSVPATIYRANGFMRAVYVTKGKHLIEFDYLPDSLRYGFYLAAFALTIVCVLLGFFLWVPVRRLLRI